MNRMSIVILWALALLVLQPALAAEPRQQPTARAGTHGHDFPPTCRHVAGHLWPDHARRARFAHP